MRDAQVGPETCRWRDGVRTLGNAAAGDTSSSCQPYAFSLSRSPQSVPSRCGHPRMRSGRQTRTTPARRSARMGSRSSIPARSNKRLPTTASGPVSESQNAPRASNSTTFPSPIGASWPANELRSRRQQRPSLRAPPKARAFGRGFVAWRAGTSRRGTAAPFGDKRVPDGPRLSFSQQAGFVSAAKRGRPPRSPAPHCVPSRPAPVSLALSTRRSRATTGSSLRL